MNVKKNTEFFIIFFVELNYYYNWNILLYKQIFLFFFHKRLST